MDKIDYKKLEIVITIAIFRLMHLAGRTLDSHPRGYGILTCRHLRHRRLTADKLISFSQVMTHPSDWVRKEREEEEELRSLLEGTWRAKFCPHSLTTERQIREIWDIYTDQPCPDWLVSNFVKEVK